MFAQNLIDWPLTSERLTWSARQVVRDLNDEPHVLERVRLTGTHFDERAEEAFLQVGEVRSLFARIDPDGLGVNGYFDRRLPAKGVVEFGYGEEVLLRCARPFTRRELPELDRKRLPAKVRFLRGEEPVD